MVRHACLSAFALLVLLAGSASAQDRLQQPDNAPLVGANAQGRLVYSNAPNGDRVPDFSVAGYGGGGVAIPTPRASVVVAPVSGDATAMIQAAIERVSAMPLRNGFRGAVQLQAGAYRLDGRLRIRASGVVLRGAGAGENGTVLTAAGVARDSLITIEGEGAPAEVENSRRAVNAAYTPVGARTLTLASTDGLRVGDSVRVLRPSTAEWIAALGMNQFEGWRPENRLHWQPGSRDIVWDRRIVEVRGSEITLDAPITTALDARYGGGFVYKYSFDDRLTNVGIENLRLVSTYDTARPYDEDHAWFAISMDKVRDGWIRNVSALHFVSYVVNLGQETSRITVQDVTAAEPISEIGGFRRRVYYAAGQQILFNRCASDNGSHDFVLGHTAAGPNVFLDCRAVDAHDDSGPIESWASGALFDNVIVRSGPLRLANRGRDGQGVGWSAANSLLWNCEATDIEADNPPGAFNLAVGCKGVTHGPGIVSDARIQRFRDFYRAEIVQPRSLYVAQLTERVGARAAEAALAPARYSTPARGPLFTQTDLDAYRVAQAQPAPPVHRLEVRNGRFMIGDEEAWKRNVGFSWFQAQMPPSLAASFGPAITRFAPGRTGVGATDDLPSMVANMQQGDVFVHHYGLWYDRRRVDHNYFGSPDERSGEVWGPFIELPWARSGEGRAWDGLSKYDLTRFNPWFFQRVKDYADLADQHERVLYYNFYFQHWLLESRAHYVDFPWRPVNTIQDTRLANEVGSANIFYDVSDPTRRELHRLYIRHSLDTLAENSNVVYGIDREYTGPLSFVQFWLDTIFEWEREHNKRVFIALEVPKAQMDALLADPVRGPRIDAIGFHAWVYRSDGRVFAARGGINRAPRQQLEDILMPGDVPAGGDRGQISGALWRSSPAMKYRALREYRDRYSRLVILGQRDEFAALSQAVEARIPAEVRASVRAGDVVAAPRENAWGSAAADGALLVYSTDGAAVTLAPRHSGRAYRARWVSEASAETIETSVARNSALTPPPVLAGRPWAVWLTPQR